MHKKFMRAVVLIFLFQCSCAGPYCEPPVVFERNPDSEGEYGVYRGIESFAEEGEDSSLFSAEGRHNSNIQALLERADSIRDELLKHDPPVEVMLELADLYESGGRYPDAIDWYRRTIDKAKPLFRIYNELIEKFGDNAVGEINPGCKVKSPGQSFESASKLAESLLVEDELEAAFVCSREALSIIAYAYRKRAESLHEIESSRRAVSDIEKALEIMPDDPDSLFLYGAFTFNMEPSAVHFERAKRAAAAWKKFLDESPGHLLAGHVRSALKEVHVLMEEGAFKKE